ncbi:PilZ domain-containing protein [Piscibacillus salipiscarius]|uniref:PilZ domain-containing protein n=1 Tax=Piscibacillus salipiscarius TaxID=299480 RepID=A0ABW5Q769_9BACI|nr:PilZ domain-containing protein [Piscibacillus salipiscarius]
MKYVIFYELIIIIASLLFIMKLLKKNKIRLKQINLLQHELKSNTNKPVTNSVINNRRGDYRVNVHHEPIELTFLHSQHQNLNKLAGKKMHGYIKDISISGIKIVSEYNLPISSNILVESYFSINGEEFNIRALLLRKEEHIKESLITYGLHFEDLNYEIEKRLAVCLHKLEASRRNSIS